MRLLFKRAAVIAALLLCGTGCGISPADEPLNPSVPSGPSGESITGEALSPLSDALLEQVRDALRQQGEAAGAVACTGGGRDYAVDAGEKFLPLLRLEEWEPGDGRAFPSGGESLRFSLGKAFRLTLSDDTSLAKVEQGEWNETTRIYRLPSGTVRAVRQYAEEHSCLDEQAALSRCESLTLLPVTGVEGGDAVRVTGELRALWEAAPWHYLDNNALLKPSGSAFELVPPEGLTIAFYPDTGTAVLSHAAGGTARYQWSAEAMNALRAYVQEHSQEG